MAQGAQRGRGAPAAAARLPRAGVRALPLPALGDWGDWLRACVAQEVGQRRLFPWIAVAFALGILSLLGNRVPVSIKVFLTALAIIDDLGAIVVIALFYSDSFSWLWFGAAAAIFGAMILLNYFKIKTLIPYLLLGAGLWYTLHHAGIHATIAGVLTAFAVPFGDGGERSPSYILQHFLHKPVAFLIMPLFALANAGLLLESGWTQDLATPIGLGILIGLLLGKPLGVLLGVWFARRFEKSESVKIATWT